MIKKHLTNFVNISLISCISISCLSLTGCINTNSFTNKTPDIVYPTVISFDELGDQTAGLIFTDNTKFILTKSAIDKYYALVDKWGDKEIPVIKKEDGIEKLNDIYYSMSAKAFYNFCRLSLKENNQHLQ